jgi:hypothetical protein
MSRCSLISSSACSRIAVIPGAPACGVRLVGHTQLPGILDLAVDTVSRAADNTNKGLGKPRWTSPAERMNPATLNCDRQCLRHVTASQPCHYPWIQPNPTLYYRPEQAHSEDERRWSVTAAFELMICRPRVVGWQFPVPCPPSVLCANRRGPLASQGQVCLRITAPVFFVWFA